MHMVRYKRFLVSALVALTLLVVGVSPALADGPGLGSSWPNTPDVSTNPQFHVYRWSTNGITYVQVNDLAGNVQLAVGVVGQQVFVLPAGNPSVVNIVAPASTSTSSDAPVYSDSTVTVSQSPTTSTFNVRPAVQPGCTDPAECSAITSP
jgi:hypothetical protein